MFPGAEQRAAAGPAAGESQRVHLAGQPQQRADELAVPGADLRAVLAFRGPRAQRAAAGAGGARGGAPVGDGRAGGRHHGGSGGGGGRGPRAEPPGGGARLARKSASAAELAAAAVPTAAALERMDSQRETLSEGDAAESGAEGPRGVISGGRTRNWGRCVRRHRGSTSLTLPPQMRDLLQRQRMVVFH